MHQSSRKTSFFAHPSMDHWCNMADQRSEASCREDLAETQTHCPSWTLTGQATAAQLSACLQAHVIRVKKIADCRGESKKLFRLSTQKNFSDPVFCFYHKTWQINQKSVLQRAAKSLFGAPSKLKLLSGEYPNHVWAWEVRRTLNLPLKRISQSAQPCLFPLYRAAYNPLLP